MVPFYTFNDGFDLASLYFYVYIKTCTVYVPIEARYPIEAHPPFREKKLHTMYKIARDVYICNKMERLSNQNDI